MNFARGYGYLVTETESHRVLRSSMKFQALSKLAQKAVLKGRNVVIIATCELMCEAE